MSARWDGRFFGYGYAHDVFKEWAEREIVATRRLGHEPPATNDMVAFLTEWRIKRPDAAAELRCKTAIHGVDYAKAWNAGAREGYLKRAVEMFEEFLTELLAHIPSSTNTFAMVQTDAARIVEVFVFPEIGEPYEGYLSDTKAVLGSIRDQVADALGWVERTDGVGFCKRDGAPADE